MLRGKHVVFFALLGLILCCSTLGKPTKKRCRPELVDLVSSDDDSVVQCDEKGRPTKRPKPILKDSFTQTGGSHLNCDACGQKLPNRSGGSGSAPHVPPGKGKGKGKGKGSSRETRSLQDDSEINYLDIEYWFRIASIIQDLRKITFFDELSLDAQIEE